MISPNLFNILLSIYNCVVYFGLRGLSSPETSRGNLFGILGMVIAIVTFYLRKFFTGFIFVFNFWVDHLEPSFTEYQ